MAAPAIDWSPWYKSMLALVLWREARGEVKTAGIDALRAVAHVIKNRVEATHLPDTWDDVITARWQFSSINASWPIAAVAADQAKKAEPLPDSFLKIHKNNIITDPTLVSWPNADKDPVFAQCMAVAIGVIDETDSDLTGGATHYANLSVCDPPWAHTLKQLAVIGHHTFFA